MKDKDKVKNKKANTDKVKNLKLWVVDKSPLIRLLKLTQILGQCHHY